MLTYKVRTAGQILLVPTEDILPPLYNPRTIISSDELAALAHSISILGMLNPILVKPEGEGKYRVISGERRRIAAGIAGLIYIPCIVMNVSNEMSHIYSVAENIHRRNLHYLELSASAEELSEIFTFDEISSYLSVHQGDIQSRIRLLSLPENIRWKIISGNLSESAANQICSIRDDRIKNAVVEAMVTMDLSFKDAYRIASEKNNRTVFSAHYKDYTVFENTIEHAAETMKAAGISADIIKSVSDEAISYSIVINKVVRA